MKWHSGYGIEIISHFTLGFLVDQGGRLSSPPVSTLTPVPGLSLPICSIERSRLLGFQSSPNLDLAGIQANLQSQSWLVPIL